MRPAAPAEDARRRHVRTELRGAAMGQLAMSGAVGCGRVRSGAVKLLHLEEPQN